MLRQEPKQLSLHSILYSKIPEHHILKLIDTYIDFSFINELLKETYCTNFGRPAKEPELMCKLLFIQHLYELSDEVTIREANLNLAYMYFIGVNPEDELPDKSLLCKFRRHRLGNSTLDEMMIEITKQCVELGIIKGTGVSIDATHVEANTIKKTPERMMKHLARNIKQLFEEEKEEALTNIPETPDYQEIEDHKEAKAVMKNHLELVIHEAENQGSSTEPQTSEAIQEAKDILADPKFMAQKGIRSLVDLDARVGRKGKNQSFYGYKTEFMMTTDERIITSVRTSDGAAIDGSDTKDLLTETKKSGLCVEEVFGDKAYFRKDILDDIKSLGAKAYIPVSPLVYRMDEEQFSYNKDADEWHCSQGNTTVKKKYYTSNNKDGKREGYKYYFEMNQCKACPLHDQCAKRSARRILTVGVNTPEFYRISQYQKTEAFKEKYKKRASIEGKNAELKRFHGL
ncbi:transposase, partial [Pontibacillus marinus BH030004 = DSM 16465]